MSSVRLLGRFGALIPLILVLEDCSMCGVDMEQLVEISHIVTFTGVL